MAWPSGSTKRKRHHSRWRKGGTRLKGIGDLKVVSKYIMNENLLLAFIRPLQSIKFYVTRCIQNDF